MIEGHNEVNQRLRYETKSNDLLWPKVPFPQRTQCYSCVIDIDQNGDAIQYNEDEVYRYLKEFYNVINLNFFLFFFKILSFFKSFRSIDFKFSFNNN